MACTGCQGAAASSCADCARHRSASVAPLRPRHATPLASLESAPTFPSLRRSAPLGRGGRVLVSDPVARARHLAFDSPAPARAKGGAPTCPGHGVKRADLYALGSSFDVKWFLPLLGQEARPDALQLLGVRRVVSLDGSKLRWRTDRAIECACQFGIESESSTTTGLRFDIDGVTKIFSLQVGAFAEGQPPMEVTGYYLGQQVVRKEVPLVDRRPGSRSCHDALLDAWEDRFTCLDRVELRVPLDAWPRLVGLTNWKLHRKPFYVALTFDYGPDPTGDAGNATRKLLDELDAQQDVRATFFVDYINARTPTGEALVRRMIAAGHEIGLSGVDPHALHCNYSTVKGVSDLRPASPCASSTPGECFRLHLDDMLTWLRGLGASPRFARAPIGENPTCRILYDKTLYSSPCRAGESLTKPDAGLTFEDLQAALVERGLTLYLRGGTAVPKQRDRSLMVYGPSSWFVQLDFEDK